MELTNSFVREFECCSSTLQIHQAEIGDVGCVVWDAAMVLAKYLELGHKRQSLDIHGKKIIELGAGTGIVGLCAAVLGAQVVITDLAEFLPLMQLNIDNNKSSIYSGNIEASILSWDDEVDNFLPSPDYLIMSDVIYYEMGLDPLIATIQKLAGQDTSVLISYEDRTLGNKMNLIHRFLYTMQKDFKIKEIQQEDLDEIYRSDDIHILRLQRK